MENDNPFCIDDKYFRWVMRCLMFFLVVAGISIFKLLVIDGWRGRQGDFSGRVLLMIRQIVELEARMSVQKEARNGH